MTMPCVLIVDDDRQIRELLARYIHSMGYSTVLAASASEALTLLDDPKSPSVDVLLSDILMPRMSGIELLQTVREKNPDLPVALITGAATIDNSIAALNAGAYAYLLKPVQSKEVAAVISKGLQIAEEKRSRNSLEAELIERYQILEERLMKLQEGQQIGGDPLGELIRGLRHELGNATTAIKLNLSVLEQEGRESDGLREHLRDLEVSTDELVSLVTRLKQYPKQNNSVDIVDLRELMNSLTLSIEDKLRVQNIRLDLKMPDEDIYVRGVDVDLMRVYDHLLNNAAEATMRACGRNIQVIVTVEEAEAVVTINDEGTGFPSETDDILFSPGYTTKITDGMVRGLGLGLFIARTTLTTYGGQIQLKNFPNGGASVRTSLPLAVFED